MWYQLNERKTHKLTLQVPDGYNVGLARIPAWCSISRSSFKLCQDYHEIQNMQKWCLELLPLVGIRCFEAKIEEVKRPAAAGNWTQDTWVVQAVLCNQTSTSPHNPLYVLHRQDKNASVAHPAATQQYSPRSDPETISDHLISKNVWGAYLRIERASHANSYQNFSFAWPLTHRLLRPCLCSKYIHWTLHSDANYIQDLTRFVAL